MAVAKRPAPRIAVLQNIAVGQWRGLVVVRELDRWRSTSKVQQGREKANFIHSPALGMLRYRSPHHRMNGAW